MSIKKNIFYGNPTDWDRIIFLKKKRLLENNINNIPREVDIELKSITG